MSMSAIAATSDDIRVQVTKDQPALVKNIVEHWVFNRPWFD